MKEKEVYEHKQWNSHHYIELQKGKDSIIGTYFGIETLSNGKLIYYKSEFSCPLISSRTQRKSKEINFILVDYSYSLKPLFKNNNNKELITDLSTIPPYLSQRQIFRGKFYGEILELHRTLDGYDSRFDIMIFLKEGYEERDAMSEQKID